MTVCYLFRAEKIKPMPETINTAKVTGRRELHFNTMREVLDDAERLAAGEWRPLGNWSLGKVCQHLAQSLDSATDDNQVAPPRVIGWIVPLMKGWILKHGMKPGFQMSRAMKPVFMPPDEVETMAGLEAFRVAVDRFESAQLPARSKFLGRMTRDEWIAFHCRHAEMHLSFIVPANDCTAATAAGAT